MFERSKQQNLRRLLRAPRLKFIPWVHVLFLAALCLMAVSARAAGFTASLDRDTIALGETATLSLAFDGGSPKILPSPDVPGLQIINTGNSQNLSIVNGQMSSTVTVTYSITPSRTGAFVIPPLTADVNGHAVACQPLRLTVLKADAPSVAAVNSGSELAFMQISLPVKKVYVGQVVQAQLQICLRDDVQNFANFNFTGTPATGFSVGKMNQGQNRRTQIGNRVYTVVPLTFTLTAIQSGNLTVGPFTASAIVVVPSANGGGGDPFFRQFFNQGEQKPVSLATETLDVQSLPLPDQNVPANFNGAVGDYSMTVTAGPTNVAVGDPITVRVQIAGRGALDAISLPDQPAWHDFKTYPPTSKVATSDQLGIEGTKTFEQIVTPENTDVRELPSFSFSFFDPETGTYRTLTQPGTPLVVQSGGVTVMPAIAANQNSTPENQAPPDILPIKEKLETLATKSAPLVAQPVFIAVQTVPVLALLAAFIWRRRTDSLAKNPRLRRQRAVAQLVRDGLNDLNRFAVKNESDEFFALLFRLLQEQLGERLDCPASAITENVLEEHPGLRRAPAATLDDLRELFQLCNQARYAPVRGTSELNSVAAKLEKTLGELQEVRA